ncbi:MAG: hypothetical protein VX129_03150 [Candidatus Thermoplasmatota archaeon]|nr:hypothetical protein [Candidatus Thermoplasmatota archaeon]
MERVKLSAFFAIFLLISMIFYIPNSSASEELTGGIAPIHLNMKEASDLTPETWGDVTKEAMKDNPPRSWSSYPLDQGRSREWKSIGTWTATNGINFDIGLSAPVKFNLWWRETNQGQDDSYDAQVQYRFRLNIDGVDAAYYSDQESGTQYECAESEPCQWIGDTNDLNVSSAAKGAIFEIEIEYWAFSDIEIYYDNSTLDSGVMLGTTGIKFGNSQINGQEINFNFVQAWNADVKEAIAGNFLTLKIAGIDLINSEQRSGFPKIEEGAAYNFNGSDITSTKITWYVDDEYAKLEQTVISFSFARLGSVTPQIQINVADILIEGSDNTEDEGILGLPGFEFVVVISALVFTSFIRRKV